MHYIFIFFSASLFFSTSLFAQINGRVLSKENGKPLSEVNVIVKGDGTTTDKLGNFFIDVPIGSEIVFSHLGYKTQTKSALDNMEIVLEINPVIIKEVLVISGLNDEVLQKSSHNVSVITDNELKRTAAHHFQNLTYHIPNLTWVGGTSRPRYFQIRGIGERSHYFGEGAPNFSVGFILDDIDLTGLGMVGNLFDLKQVEIFKGPQSSVFNTNSLAGLISLKSEDPGQSIDFKSLISLGTDDNISLNNALDLPISKNFGIRFSGSYNYSNGFRKNIYLQNDNSNQRKESFYKMKINYDFKDINFLTTLIYADLDNGYDSWAPDNNKNFETYTDDIGKDSQKTIGGSIRIKKLIYEKILITGITSLTETDLTHSYDGDWANDDYWNEKHGFDQSVEGWSYKFFDENFKNRKNLTQEIRLSAKNMILGFYYKKMRELDRATGYLFGGLGTSGSSQFDFEVISSYLQFDYQIFSKLKFSSNFRVENDKINYLGKTSGMDNYWNVVELPDVNYTTKNLMNGFRASFNYQISNALNFISSFAKGYKSGGVNQQPLLNDANRPYNPELLYSSEISLKHKTNNSFSNIVYFYGLRKNQQVSVSSQQIVGDPNSFFFYTSNAAKGKSSGVELESKIMISENLQFGISAAYLDTWVDGFDYFTSGGIATSSGNREAAIAPKYSGSLNINYKSKSGVDVGLITNYKSRYYYSDSHNEESSPYTITNLLISKKLGQKLSIELWARNIFDERYSTRGFYFGLIPPSYSEQLFESFADPLQFGLSLKYD